MHIVTKEWMEACFIEGKLVPEDGFTPDIAQNNSSLSTEDMQKFRKHNYNVKRGLFKGITFAIRDETFDEIEVGQRKLTRFGEFDSKEQMIETMIRTIIENGGKVVPSQGATSQYIITEDGADPTIWN